MHFGSIVHQALRTARAVCGLMLVLAAVAGTVQAGGPIPDATPEIDPGSMVSALTLLTGGVLLLWRRRPSYSSPRAA